MNNAPAITQETIKSTSVEAQYSNEKSVDILGLKYRPIDQTVSESCQVF